MVIGQADRPLLDRHLARADLDLAVLVEALLLAGAAEHERAGIGRVGQEVVHRPIVRGRPPHAPLADASARKLLALRDQLADDLARRAEPVPQLEDALDRVAHLLIGGQHDPPVLVAIEPDRRGIRSSPRLALLRSPPSSRARIRCSSASDIVPFSPSSSRSLKSAGE